MEWARFSIIGIALVSHRFVLGLTEGERNLWLEDKYVLMLNAYKYVLGQINIVLVMVALFCTTEKFNWLLSAGAWITLMLYIYKLLDIFRDDRKIAIRPAAVLLFTSILFTVVWVFVRNFIL